MLAAPQLVEDGMGRCGEQIAFQRGILVQLLALLPYLPEAVLHNLRGFDPRFQVAVSNWYTKEL